MHAILAAVRQVVLSTASSCVTRLILPDITHSYTVYMCCAHAEAIKHATYILVSVLPGIPYCVLSVAFQVTTNVHTQRTYPQGSVYPNICV